MTLSPYKLHRRLRYLESEQDALRAKIERIPDSKPGGLTYFDPTGPLCTPIYQRRAPSRLAPDEGDLIRVAWDDLIEAEERAARRIVEVLEVTRHPYADEDRALVRRGSGQTETVVLPEDVKLKAGHDYGTSYRLYMLVDLMNARGL